MQLQPFKAWYQHTNSPYWSLYFLLYYLGESRSLTSVFAFTSIFLGEITICGLLMLRMKEMNARIFRLGNLGEESQNTEVKDERYR